MLKRGASFSEIREVDLDIAECEKGLAELQEPEQEGA
jgi:hypothetical protein